MERLFRMIRIKRRSHNRKEQKRSRPEVKPIQQTHESGVSQGQTTLVFHRMRALTTGYH